MVDSPDAELIRATSPLLIVGASVRAAAQSARRAGWQELLLFDQFQDRDLPSGHRGGRLENLNLWPEDRSEISEARAWMYTGALENRPDVVQRISRGVPLIGCPRESLLRVRDPGQLAEALRAADLPYAEVLLAGSDLSKGSWLRKPRKSAAGRGIWFVDDPQKAFTDPDVYYQRYICGTPCAGAFLAAGRTTCLLGVTQQLIGDPRFGAAGFQYAGSVGPISLTSEQHEQWQRIGSTLTGAFGLQGLFGVDALDTGERIVPVEVNPRYTASMELMEFSWKWPMVAWHVRACRNESLPVRQVPNADSCCGKAIVFALQPGEWTARCARWIDAWNASDAWPAVADIPRIGTPVSPGLPILTVFARGAATQEVSDRLADLAARVWDVVRRGW